MSAILTTANAGLFDKLVEDVAKEVIDNNRKEPTKAPSKATRELETKVAGSEAGTFEDAMRKFPELKAVPITKEELVEQKQFITKYKIQYSDIVAD